MSDEEKQMPSPPRSEAATSVPIATRSVRRFEDLIAWQKARALVKEIYLISQQGRFARDFGLANQIQRAAVSSMANIAEGSEKMSSKEFHQYLTIAKGSNAEVRSDLYSALDIGYITSDQFERLMPQAEEVARLIGGLRAAIARRIAS